MPMEALDLAPAGGKIPEGEEDWVLRLGAKRYRQRNISTVLSARKMGRCLDLDGLQRKGVAGNAQIIRMTVVN